MKNKFLIDHLEKIILGGLIIVLIGLATAYSGGFYFKEIDIKIELSPVKFSSPPKNLEGLDKYKKALEGLQKEKRFASYEAHFDRNAFSKYVKELPSKPLFDLKSIKKLPLDIQYNGFIEYSGGIIGQVNFRGATHFVKEDEKLAEYKILELYRKYAIIKDHKGNKIRLPLRKRVLSNEYEATIYLTREDRRVRVKKGDRVKDFQVLDILPTYVVLFNETTKEKKFLR